MQRKLFLIKKCLNKLRSKRRTHQSSDNSQHYKG